MDELVKRAKRLTVWRLALTGSSFVLWLSFAIYSKIFNIRISKFENVMSFGFCLIIVFSLAQLVIELLSKRVNSDAKDLIISESLENDQKSEIIDSLFASYDSLYYLNLKTSRFDTIGINPMLNEMHVEMGYKNIDCKSYVNLFAAEFLYPEHREEFLNTLNIEYLGKMVREKGSFEYTFLLPINGVPNYIKMKAILSKENTDMVMVGFANVDKEVRNEQRTGMMLKESMEQASKANETKDTFLANISHELKTPLNAVVAYASLITLDEDGKEKSQLYAKDILKETDILLGAVENLFNMSMIKNGEMILDDYPTNLTYTVETAIDNLKEKAEGKRIKINSTINVDHNDVFCDGAKVGEICQKILDNAIVYSKPDSDVYISLVEIRRVNDTVLYEIQIIDHGCGMDEEFVKTIFEPFKREATTTERGILGIGLGMTITKYYIELMNGSIDIDSKKNEGTKVTIKLNFRLAGK